MLNSAPFVQWTTVLIMVGATVMPFTAHAETSSNQEADARRAPAYAAAAYLASDSGDEPMVAPPTQGVAEGSADIPLPDLRPRDPTRRCGNIMSVWDEPCNYAGQGRVSVETTAIRP